MTVRMAVYYRPPDDADAFEQRYLEGHIPLVAKYGGIQEYSFNKVSRVMSGDFPYAYAFVGTWSDRDAWKADMQSEHGRAVVDDAASFATQGFDVVVFEELA